MTTRTRERGEAGGPPPALRPPSPRPPAAWERPVLLAAAAQATTWAVLMLAIPDRIFESVPSWPAVPSALVACEAVCLVLAAFRESPWIVGAALGGKAIAPLAFLAAVGWGWVSSSSWPWVLLNDGIWILPLALAWRRRLAA